MLIVTMMLPRSVNSLPSELGGEASMVGGVSKGLWENRPEFHEVLKFTNLVESRSACALPGCSIKEESFVPCLKRAMSRGYVKDSVGEYMLDGLKNGFTLGVAQATVVGSMGRRYFKNYPTALENRNSITDAVVKRVGKSKTLSLGLWSAVKPALEAVQDCCIFPMGAVPKGDGGFRPTSDHSRTGWNAFTVMGILEHTLDTYKKVSWLLQKNHFMYVSDVEDAFLIIPLAPWVWWFFMLRCYATRKSKEESVFMHMFADFGSKGMPGTFKLFLVDVVVQMARSEMIMSLPLVIHVDDVGMIGPVEEDVNTEMEAFQAWTVKVCGVWWKKSKDRRARMLQLFCGFWWNSTNFTRELVKEKITAYLEVLFLAASSLVLTLQLRQSLAGKMQRAVLTFPPGASCLLVTCYSGMSSLKLPWHKSRTSKVERDNYRLVHDLLKLNLGKGYYRYDDFVVGLAAASDACKSSKLTGGGWWCADGEYDFFSYGVSASRKLIDELEADVVVRAVTHNAHKWRGCIVPFGIDNQSFLNSVKKGRSKVDRLNAHCVRTFHLQLKFGFVFQPYYINTEDNYLADDLSRDHEDLFLLRVADSGFMEEDCVLARCPDAGRVVTFARSDTNMGVLRQLLQEFSSNVSLDGPGGSRSSGNLAGIAQQVSITYPLGSIFDGLPADCHDRLCEVLGSDRARINF